MKKSLSLVLASVFVLGACQGAGHKEGFGTILGSIGGGVIGSTIGKGSGNTAAIIAGTVIGGFIGNQIGQSLDRADRMYANRAMQNAFEVTPVNHRKAWRNPDSGNSGYFQPRRTYRNSSGQYCRDVETVVIVNGKRERAYTKGCRMPDGTWKIVG